MLAAEAIPLTAKTRTNGLRKTVQCTVARGLDVVGVIYPGDNPSISF